MARIVIHLFISSVFLHGAITAAPAKELLKESASFFDKGQYQKALLILRSVNIRQDLDNSDDMKLAFKIRAIAYEQINDHERAKEAIRELFFLDQNYQFNPFDTPVSVIALAHKERAAIADKNKELLSVKNEALLQAQIATKPLEKTFLIERKPAFATTLFPFGLNHFYLNAPVKGAIYLSAQTLSLGTNVLAFWWKQSYLFGFGSRHLKDPSHKDHFDIAQLIQYIALGAVILSYGASVVDALIEWQQLPSEKLVLSKES